MTLDEPAMVVRAAYALTSKPMLSANPASHVEQLHLHFADQGQSSPKVCRKLLSHYVRQLVAGTELGHKVNLKTLIIEGEGAWNSAPSRDDAIRRPQHYQHHQHLQRLQRLQRLLDSDSGIDCDAPNTQGHTALYYALATGDTAMMERLIAYGANPNRHDANGYTPLHHAIVEGNTEAVHLLLALGADPQQVNRSPNRYTFSSLENLPPHKPLKFAHKLQERQSKGYQKVYNNLDQIAELLSNPPARREASKAWPAPRTAPHIPAGKERAPIEEWESVRW